MFQTRTCRFYFSVFQSAWNNGCGGECGASADFSRRGPEDKTGESCEGIEACRQMSGGQQQRVGVARALVLEPEIIFADEPTGNLDSNTSKEVLELMRKVVREQNQTLVMVTHDNYLASFADRIIRIKDGKIVENEEKKQ